MLHALRHVPCLVDLVRDHSCVAGSAPCSLCLLKQTEAETASPGTIGTVGHWRSFVERLRPPFVWGEQQCVLEFSDGFAAGADPLDLLVLQGHIGVQQQSVRTTRFKCDCGVGPQTHATGEPTLNHIMLEVGNLAAPHEESLERMLENASAEQVLDDFHFPCPACGENGETSRRLEVTRTNSVLLVSVKRSLGVEVRSTARVLFRKELIYASGRYRLCSAVEHVGETTRGGHYVAWVCHSGGVLVYWSTIWTTFQISFTTTLSF